MYGFEAPGSLKFRQADDHESLFFWDDEELDLAQLLNAPLPQIPMRPMLNIHWLAVDGVQPMIPENESVEDDSSCRTSIKDDAFVHNVDRKPLVKHVLTEEMQLFYTKVTEAVKSDDFELQRAAFTSLARDPGIHQLLPYFARFIYEEVKHSNHDLALLYSLMRVCRCLLVNPSVHVELYVSPRVAFVPDAWLVSSRYSLLLYSCINCCRPSCPACWESSSAITRRTTTGRCASTLRSSWLKSASGTAKRTRRSRRGSPRRTIAPSQTRPAHSRRSMAPSTVRCSGPVLGLVTSQRAYVVCG